jgi:hypothetical protein
MTGLGNADTEIGCGVLCRHIGSATRTFIRAVVDATGTITVRTFTGGGNTLVGSRAASFAANDTLRMEVTGTSPNIVVKVFKNGVQQGADFTGVSGPDTGKPGLCYSSQTDTLATLDDWSGGDLAVMQQVLPDADIDAGTWTNEPLHSKLSDDSDATYITETAS